MALSSDPVAEYDRLFLERLRSAPNVLQYLALGFDALGRSLMYFKTAMDLLPAQIMGDVHTPQSRTQAEPEPPGADHAGSSANPE